MPASSRTATEPATPHSPRWPGGWGRAVVAAIALAAAAAHPANAEDPQRQRLAMTLFILGDAGGRIPPAELAAALDATERCTTTLVEAPRWDRRPDAAGDAPWLSVVVTGFGERADAMAFLFAGADAPPRLAAHIGYGKTPRGKQEPIWIVPTGAIAFAVGDFLEASAAAPPPAPRGVGLVVRQRATDQPAAGGAAGLGELRSGLEATNVDVRRALVSIEALFVAALLERGLAPGPADAAAGIEADVQFGVRRASFRVARRGGPEAALEDDVPEESYYDHLRRVALVLAAAPGTGVADFFRPDGPGPVRLLAAEAGRLGLATPAGLAVFDAATGRRVVPAPSPQGSTHLPGSYVGADGAAIRRISSGLARIDAASGAATPLAGMSPARAWGFGSADGRTAVAADRGLAVFTGGTAAAWRHDEPAAITAGPAVDGDRVFAGLETGAIVCRGLADGAERWRAGTPTEQWSGPMACLAGRVLAYDRTSRGLVAVDPADGTTLWRLPLGDGLVEPPSLIGDRAVVAAKSNRIVVFAPKDGRVVAERRWPTWLVGLVAIPGPRPLVAVADIHGDLAFLDAASLETVDTLRLPARPSGPLLHRPSFPAAWAREAAASGGDAADELDLAVAAVEPPIPAVLAADVEGFCYIVRVPDRSRPATPGPGQRGTSP